MPRRSGRLLHYKYSEKLWPWLYAQPLDSCLAGNEYLPCVYPACLLWDIGRKQPDLSLFEFSAEDPLPSFGAQNACRLPEAAKPHSTDCRLGYDLTA